MKVYYNKKDGSLILGKILNKGRSDEYVNGINLSTCQSVQVRLSSCELYGGKCYVKTSTEYDISKSFVISSTPPVLTTSSFSNDYIFFHNKDKTTVSYIKRSILSNSINTCSYQSFVNHMSGRNGPKKEIIVDVLEFKNKFESEDTFGKIWISGVSVPVPSHYLINGLPHPFYLT